MQKSLTMMHEPYRAVVTFDPQVLRESFSYGSYALVTKCWITVEGEAAEALHAIQVGLPLSESILPHGTVPIQLLVLQERSKPRY